MMPDCEFTPAPCRVLMSGGQWQVPPEARPKLREVPPDHVKAVKPEWATMPKPAAVKVKPPKKRPAVRVSMGKVGRPMGSGRIHITAAEIVRQLTERPMREIAAEQGCVESHLYRKVQQAGLTLGRLACPDCGGAMDGLSHQARRCRECARKRTLWRHNEARRKRRA